MQSEYEDPLAEGLQRSCDWFSERTDRVLFLEMVFEGKLKPELTEEESRVFRPSTEERICFVIIDAGG